MKFKDAHGVVSNTYSDDIILDVTAPTGTAQLEALAPASGRLWEPYGPSKPWYLPAGLTTVYVRFRDHAGNVSATVSASMGP